MGTTNNKQQRTTTLQFAVRIALLMGLGWLGVGTATSIKTLLSPPPVSRTEFPTIDESLALMPSAGSWRFDDSRTMISSSVTDAPTLPAVANKSEQSLAIDEPTLKAFVELDENADVSTATLAMQVENKWQVLKLGNTEKQSAAPHLLPLEKSKRICGRWSDDDQLLLEIVSVDSDRRDLLAAWRHAGWEIRHTAWGSVDSFSYLCVKDGQIVYAWSKQAGKIRSLLLSSSSDVALRRPKSKNGNHS